jgi:signal transduction histidine kinase
LGGDVDVTLEQGASVAEFFAQALDGAMALVRADGGELATLDEMRQVLVLRARRTRPRIDPALGPMGAPGRQSQPRSSALPSASLPGQSSISPAYDLAAIADDAVEPIDVQSTILLPATMISRTYRKGERLIGYTWQRGEPVMMNGDQCRTLPAGSAPADPDAPFHVAVPILRPASLALTRPTTEVIGVISIYNRDPLWSFTPRDIELLTLHADRVARAMRVADLSRQNQSQADLLSLLGSDVGGAALYPRLRDVVRRLIDAPSFAVVLYDAHRDTVTFELAERDGQPAPATVLRTSALPPWWSVVRGGHTLWISAPEDRAARPEYCALGWGGDTPVQSILAAPLHIGGTLAGAIVAGSPRPDVYAPEHARLFSTTARSAAIVIQNARLAHETRASLTKTRAKEQQLSILNNAVLTLNASLDLSETLKALVTQAALLTQDKHCIVFLRDEQDASLVGRATNIRPEDAQTPLTNVRVPLDWRNIGAILEREPFALFDDLDSDWRDDSEMGRLLKGGHVRTALLLPIEHKNGQLGALVVHAPAQRHHFTAEEIGLLQGLVSQAGGAINNAMLYQEQQETNAKLQAAIEKQKELDRLKDEFILTVSHEFRTPVTAIDGYVTLIERHGHKLEQTKLNQFAEEIRQATEQLMGMINTLHDANSIDSQPLQLSVHPHNIRAVAEKAIGLQSPESKARITLQMPADLWVLADGDRLTTVFTNLLGNAIKYSPKDAPVQLSARAETRNALAAQGRAHALADRATEQWIVVGVRDLGTGISPDDQPRLFHKFVRLSRSLTTSVRGTGLGLWICRQYVEAMGGDIWVDSEFGKGSTFQFSLPTALVASAAAGGQP